MNMKQNKLKGLSEKVFDEVSYMNGKWWSDIMNHNILFQIRHELLGDLGNRHEK